MKKIVLWVGTVIIVLMCFFPPCIEDFTMQGVHLSTTHIGYHCILCPPEPKISSAIVKVDTVRLLLQCVIVALLTGCWFYTSDEKQWAVIKKLLEKIKRMLKSVYSML